MFDILHIGPVLFTYENDWIIYNHNINYTKKSPHHMANYHAIDVCIELFSPQRQYQVNKYTYFT